MDWWRPDIYHEKVVKWTGLLKEDHKFRWTHWAWLGWESEFSARRQQSPEFVNWRDHQINAEYHCTSWDGRVKELLTCYYIEVCYDLSKRRDLTPKVLNKRMAEMPPACSIGVGGENGPVGKFICKWGYGDFFEKREDDLLCRERMGFGNVLESLRSLNLRLQKPTIWEVRLLRHQRG